MVASARWTHFSWSLKLRNFIMVNVLNALDKILRGDYRFNNCYKLISYKIAMLASMASFNDQEKCVELAGASIAIF